MSAVQLFNHVAGTSVSERDAAAFTARAKFSRAELRNDPTDVSNVCLQVRQHNSLLG